MLKDIPYSKLKQNERMYEIMLLRDQYGSTFDDLAKGYELSAARAAQLYHKAKITQIHLYINHISAALGHSDTSQIQTVYHAAYECYQDLSYACAYLETKYNDILTEYRDGERGMPARLIERMPPFKSSLSQKSIDRIITMREVEKASFAAIGKELRITQAKARHVYESFYHQQVLELIGALQEKAKSEEEKKAIWTYYFRKRGSSKTRFDLLTKESASVPKRGVRAP